MQYPDPVAVTEHLSRYVLESGKIRPSVGKLRPNAFMPARDNVLSVFRVDGLDHGSIVKLGQKYVAQPQNRTVVGYGVIRADAFSELGLNLVPTAAPHPRHVDVVGWPDTAASRNKAQILAEIAELVLV